MSGSGEDTPPTGDQVGRRGRFGAVAVLLILLVAALTYGSIALDMLIPSDAARELAALTPSPDRPDPSTAIPGVRIEKIPRGEHVPPGDEPGYASRPPVGGPHATSWAACSGVVFPDPVRDADAVHSLEHGAVWITYDPARTTPVTLEALTGRVRGDPYLFLSPYPGLDAPVSLQAWGHRLVLDAPEDSRFEQFIMALRDNPYTPPEPRGKGGPPAGG
ncbi:DUF3105 domain-containing protein [Pseudonocardia nigra]|uniref:DUF3105 domain-containing protein n=1 Tax=Pseudonocardia nigra TaxID=1921578 RepID=UPI001C5E6079|nr:DUF3105 domain-containing protein [Pseudonocardia nigra]